jgi:hypothetical protein
MAGGRDWTTTEARKLHELRARRVKGEDIARILGRTKHSINNFLRYVPVAPGRPPSRRHVPRIDQWTADDLRTLRNLAAKGVSARKVAELLCRTPSAVKNKAQLERIRLGERRG